MSVAQEILSLSIPEANEKIRFILKDELIDWDIESHDNWYINDLAKYVFIFLFENYDKILRSKNKEVVVDDSDIRQFCGVSQEDDSVMVDIQTVTGHLASKNFTKQIIDRIIHNDSLDFHSQGALYGCIMGLFCRDFKGVIERMLKD